MWYTFCTSSQSSNISIKRNNLGAVSRSRSTVVDGIVVAVTGHSGGEWAATAIRQVLNKKYSSNVYIPTDLVCAGYPMYGWKPDYCR